VASLLEAEPELALAAEEGSGLTFLMRASAVASEGALAAVQALLAAGADSEAKDMTGKTPIFYAVRFGSSEVVEQLLVQGMPASQQDRAGLSLLHHAVLAESSQVLQLLLSQGADAEATDSKGNTARQLAQVRHKQLGTDSSAAVLACFQ
jgi:ankyrin repeat protein